MALAGLDIVYCPFPDAAQAENAARLVVEEGLAACAQVLAPALSVFRWEGAIDVATEVPLLCKTGAGQGAELARRIAALHPYDLPAVVHWPAGCSPQLARWAAAGP